MKILHLINLLLTAIVFLCLLGCNENQTKSEKYDRNASDEADTIGIQKRVSSTRFRNGNESRLNQSGNVGITIDAHELDLEFVDGLSDEIGRDTINMRGYHDRVAEYLQKKSFDEYLEFMRVFSDRFNDVHYLSRLMISYFAENNAKQMMLLQKEEDVLDLLSLDAKDIPAIVAQGIFKSGSLQTDGLVERITSVNFTNKNVRSLVDGYLAARFKEENQFEEIAPLASYLHDEFLIETGVFDYFVVALGIDHPAATLELIRNNEWTITEDTLYTVTYSYFTKDPISAMEYMGTWPDSELKQWLSAYLSEQFRERDPDSYQRWVNSQLEMEE